jgi:hypothetical protein
MTTDTDRKFPVDWTEWHAEWIAWREQQTFKPSAVTFGKKNMLADDVLGIYDLSGGAVELSEVTFPGFGAEDRGKTFRYVGITWAVKGKRNVNGGLVETFGELEQALAAGPPDD